MNLTAIAISTVCAAILSLLGCTYLIRKSSQKSLEAIELATSNWIQQYDATIKKAYGIIGSLGVDSRTQKQGERLIAQEIIDQEPLIKAGIEFLSPQLQEWIEEHPDQALELMPRIEGLVNKFLGEDSESSRPHPFGQREE